MSPIKAENAEFGVDFSAATRIAAAKASNGCDCAEIRPEASTG